MTQSWMIDRLLIVRLERILLWDYVLRDQDIRRVSLPTDVFDT